MTWKAVGHNQFILFVRCPLMIFQCWQRIDGFREALLHSLSITEWREYLQNYATYIFFVIFSLSSPTQKFTRHKKTELQVYCLQTKFSLASNEPLIVDAEQVFWCKSILFPSSFQRRWPMVHRAGARFALGIPRKHRWKRASDPTSQCPVWKEQSSRRFMERYENDILLWFGRLFGSDWCVAVLVHWLHCRITRFFQFAHFHLNVVIEWIDLIRFGEIFARFVQSIQ